MPGGPCGVPAHLHLRLFLLCVGCFGQHAAPARLIRFRAAPRAGIVRGRFLLHRTDNVGATHRTELQQCGTVRAETAMLARFDSYRRLHVEAQRAGILAHAQLAQLLQEQMTGQNNLKRRRKENCKLESYHRVGFRSPYPARSAPHDR